MKNKVIVAERKFVEVDYTLLVFAFFGYIMTLAEVKSTQEIIWGFGSSLIILGFMLGYSIFKKSELVSTSLVIFGIGLSLSNEEFVIYSLVAITFTLISILNKSVKKLVVGDLFLATIAIALTYLVTEGIKSFENVLFLFFLLAVVKYIIVVYYFNNKRPDYVNNTWTIFSTVVILLRVIS